MFKIMETKERILADNEAAAAQTRLQMQQNGQLFINLMGSPGAGKTCTLLSILSLLGRDFNIGVMEADVDGSKDTETMLAAGAKAIQLHTAGLCHMDADMTARGLEAFKANDCDIIFLENIGNLVCPAEFDVGADLKIMILSVPEGDDKPLKYPLMFTVSDVLIINKIDTCPIFDFSIEKASERAKALNPNIKIFPVSAKTGEGFAFVAAFLASKAAERRAQK